MAEIFQFPDKERREWDQAKKEYQNILRKCGFQDAVIDQVLQEFEDIIPDIHARMKCHFPLDQVEGLTPDQKQHINRLHLAGLDQIARQFRDLSSDWTLVLLGLLARAVTAEMMLV